MKFEEGSIYFNKLVILQSLNENESKTGDDLLDEIKRKDSSVHAEINDVPNKSQFVAQLLKLKNDCLLKGALPFLHLEMHGCTNGIILRSGEEMSWAEVVNILREVNIASKNNLFLSLATCFGGYIQYAIDINDPCPFRGFIGPMGAPFNADLLISFTEFFKTILESNDLEISINLLNYFNESGVKFHHLNSENFFDLILEKIEDQYCENRIDSITNEKWNSDLRVQKLYKNISNLRASVEKKHNKLRSKMIQEQRKMFLHIE